MIFYTIAYNWTLLYKTPYLQQISASMPKDDYAMRLKISIDNGLAEFFSDFNIQVASRINNGNNSQVISGTNEVTQDAEWKRYVESQKKWDKEPPKQTLNAVWQDFP